MMLRCAYPHQANTLTVLQSYFKSHRSQSMGPLPEFEMVSVVDDNAFLQDSKLPWNDRAKVAHQISSKVRAWKKCPQRKLCFT